MKKIAVIYHTHCPDGFTAAWAAWKKFHDRADYYPVEPRALPSVELKDKEIYILDNSISQEDLAALERHGNRVTVIDHHISSEDDVKRAKSFVFNNAHSGAVLAWEYFHPKKPVPQFLKHVEDIDLWRFKVPHTREISMVANLTKYEFKAWSVLVSTVENPARRKKMIEEGKLLLRYNNELVRRQVENAGLVEFMGHRACAVNTPILQSETGNALARTKAPVAIMWYERDGVRRFSLRGNGKIDVAALAAEFGGGGHHDAAGFVMKLDEPLPWKQLLR